MDIRKNNILSAAAKLIAAKGYDRVTMKDIANASETTSTEVYTHFFSKQFLLEGIYKRYSEVLLHERLNPEKYIPILKTGTAEEILNIFNFPLPEPQDVNFCIVRIVLIRKLSDRQAQAVYLQQQEKAGQYLKEVLTKGVELGRINMTAEEIDNFKHVLQAIRDYSSAMATMLPDQPAWRVIETNMNQSLSKLLTLNDPLGSPLEDDSAQIPVSFHDFSTMIRDEALLVARYHYYSTILRERGESRLAHAIDEIIENLLDELDSLYFYVNPAAKKLERTQIMELIKTKENVRKINANCHAKLLDATLSDNIFFQVSRLAEQHARICDWSLKNT